MNWPEYERGYQLEDWHWWFKGRQSVATALFERWLTIPLPGPILDVGCGSGGNLTFLAKWGLEMGADISPYALTLARQRRRHRLTQASSLALPYADQSFGLVTFFDVLYHSWVTNDHQAIQEAYRVLQPDGWLLITDSALPSLWSQHDTLYYARQRYTLSELRQKLRTEGFILQLTSYINMLLLPFVAYVRLVSPPNHDDLRPRPAWFNQLLLKVRHLEAYWLGRGRTLPIGSSLVCLAQKGNIIS